MGFLTNILGHFKNITNTNFIIQDSIAQYVHLGVLLYSLTCAILSTGKQFFGESILCDTKTYQIDNRVLETYCWSNMNKLNETKQFHYYQFIPLYFVFVLISCNVVNSIWFYAENGIIIQLLAIADPMDMATYYKDYLWKKQQCRLTSYITCLNIKLIWYIFLFFLTDLFLQYEFSYYGLKAIIWLMKSNPEEEFLCTKYNHSNSSLFCSPFTTTFPITVACNYNYISTGGAKTFVNLVCILPLNNINSKLYFLLWWLFIAAILFILIDIIKLLITTCSYRLRLKMIKTCFLKITKHEASLLKLVIKNCSRNDWLTFYFLFKNLPNNKFIQFMTNLNDSIQL